MPTVAPQGVRDRGPRSKRPLRAEWQLGQAHEAQDPKNLQSSRPRRRGDRDFDGPPGVWKTWPGIVWDGDINLQVGFVEMVEMVGK